MNEAELIDAVTVTIGPRGDGSRIVKSDWRMNATNGLS